MSARYKKLQAHTRTLLFVFVLLPTFLQAQLIDLPNIEVISQKDGLPFNTPTSIIQDDQGFLWIGSTDGLARYDGYSFLTLNYEPNKKNTLPNNSIITLARDHNGFIWAGHLGGFISKTDPVSLKVWSTKINGAKESFTRKIFCDKAGRIWCYVDLLGMYLFDGTKFNKVGELGELPQKGLAPANYYNKVTDITEDVNGTFWVATSNGLYNFNPATSTFKKESSISDDPNLPASLHNILPDGTNGFWLSTYGLGLVYYNRDTKTFKKYLFQPTSSGTTNIINGLARKSENEIWVGTSGMGIGVFNSSTEKFSFYLDGDALNSGPICYGMIVDRLGIVWVLSDNGLLKWNASGNNFLFKKLLVQKSDNLGYYGVNDVLMDDATGRQILGASYTEGLFIIEKDGSVVKRSFGRHPKAEEYFIINDLLKDKSGRIWVVTRDFVYELTPDNRLVEMKGINNLLPVDKVPFFYCMIQTSNGDFWLGSSRNGLFHMSAATGKWERLSTDTPNTLPDNRVYNIEEDNQNRIWIAHLREGVTVFDPAKKTYTNYKHQQNDSTSLVSNLFTDLTQTPEGEIWVSTHGGLSHFNASTGTFENWSMTNGLSTDAIYTLQSDANGILWASSNQGLLRLDPVTHDITVFDFSDGLNGNYGDFYLGKGEKGKMYICTFQGFYEFEPALLSKKKSNLVPVIITNVKHANDVVPDFNVTRQVSIDYHSNSVSIEFAALNYAGTHKNRYRYMLEGINKEWTESNSRVVNYAGLPSGSYTFRVQLIGNDDETHEGRLEIKVSTPFYKQTWFRMATIALALWLGYLIFIFRLRTVRKEERIKREFNQKLAEVELKALKAQMSPHFIFNSLNSINRYIVKSEPEKASLYLTKFSKLIRLILDNSDNKIISLDQELTGLKLYIELEALRFNDKFTYTLNVSKDLNPHSIGVPPMIIQPFIENAIWHGLLHKETTGQLAVSIERYGHGLQCIIEDNGIGREKAGELKSKSVNKEKSYGMKITTDRLSMLNGESRISNVEIIDLKDAAGNPSGTKVIVKIMSAELEPDF
jgi:ligand-binding sensor domain-containing protein